MATPMSKVSSKRQVVIPIELEDDFPLDPGIYISWSVKDGMLIGRRVRTARELAGSLKSKVSFPGHAEEKRAVMALRNKEFAKKYKGGKKN